MNNIISQSHRKDPQVPTWEESEFAKTLEGQMMMELKRSILEEHYIESTLLSWSTVEQILLPRLITFVAERLKIELPSDFQKMNVQTLNFIYYSLSHDKDLFEKLEKGRELRNKIVHKLYKEKGISEVKVLCKDATKYILEHIHKPLMERFSGQVTIPSINLYTSGWNDALSKVIEEIQSLD